MRAKLQSELQRAAIGSDRQLERFRFNLQHPYHLTR